MIRIARSAPPIFPNRLLSSTLSALKPRRRCSIGTARFSCASIVASSGLQTKQASSNNVSRRFAWFRRVLKIHEDEHAPAFLDQWRAERWLVRRFADVTKEDLRSVLIREQSRLNVSTLMDALNSTLEFEATMSRRFNTSFEDLVAPPLPATLQARHNNPRRRRCRPSLTRILACLSKLRIGPSPRCLYSIDSKEHVYLTILVRERSEEMVLSILRREGTGRWQLQRQQHGAAFLPELFYFYRQTLEQCARLSNKEPLRDLYEVYRKWLRVYAEDVSALPWSVTNPSAVDRRPAQHC